MSSEGRKYKSDFIINAIGTEDRDRVADIGFPVGGHPGHMGDRTPDERTKRFEVY